jgi:protein TonB
MNSWLISNTNYPQEAMDEEIQGKVQVGFVVATDGHIKNIAIVKSVHPLLDKEALRVIGSMPDWKPAVRRGHFIQSMFIIPITFKLY